MREPLSGGRATGVLSDDHESVYYEQASAEAIMSLSHMPDGILPLLQMESLAIYEAISMFGCDALVELGCYDGRALEVARYRDLPYIGVDLDSRAILKLDERIRREGLEHLATTYVGDILAGAMWDRREFGTRPLYVVPFNLIGTFREPARLLRLLSQSGGVAVVSVFGETAQANDVRRAYYSRSGVGSLQCTVTPDGGVLFTGDNGFYSRSYCEQELEKLVASSGGSIARISTNILGCCATVLLDSTPADTATLP